MPIWILTVAIVLGSAWLSLEPGPAWLTAVWLSCAGAVAVAPGLARALRGTPGWLFALLALAASALGALLFPDQPQAGQLSGVGLVLGGAIGVRCRVGPVPAGLIAAIWVLGLLGLLFTSVGAFVLLAGVAALPVGILLGAMFRAVVVTEAGSDESDPAKLQALGREALENFDLATARKLLGRAAVLVPGDREILEARYAAWKFDPTADEFHAVAAELLRLDDMALITRYYRDYLAVTQVRPQLDADLHLELARRFAAGGNPDDAARIVNIYLQRDTSTPGLADSLAQVSQGYAAAGNSSKAARYAETLIALFPHSDRVPEALEFLDSVRPEVWSNADAPTRRKQKPQS